MKITFVMPCYHHKPVGGFKVVYEYANRLVARGHEVVVIHPHRLTNFNFNFEESIFKSETHWHPMDNRVHMLSVPEPTPSHIPQGDAVVATFWAIAEYVINYPQEKGTKFYLLQSYETWAGPKKRVDATWLMPMEKIVISRSLYQQGISLGACPDEIMYVPEGIDHAKYRVLRNIEGRPQRIVMLYHVLPLKGAQDGIKALELTRAKFPALQAVLFGVSPRPKKLPSWIEYQCDPPQKDIVNEIYNGSSICISPSWHEGFGLPLAEAMACGCAVCTTDSGGVREFSKHEETALLSPPRKPKMLASNIIRLLKNDELRIRLAQAGRKRIQEFTWERSINLLELVLTKKIREKTTGENSN